MLLGGWVFATVKRVVIEGLIGTEVSWADLPELKSIRCGLNAVVFLKDDKDSTLVMRSGFCLAR